MSQISNSEAEAGGLPEFRARINYKECPSPKRKEIQFCWYEVYAADSGSQGHRVTTHDEVSSSQAAKAFPCHPCHKEFALKSMRKGESFQSPVLKSSMTAWDMRTIV